MQKPISLDQLDLPKASTRAAQVLHILSAEDPNLDQLNTLIAQDPILAANIIRYANSPLYHRAQPVGNVPTATRLLGIKNIRSAVVMSTLNSSVPEDDPAIRAIYDHLVAIAAFCKVIALECNWGKADDMELIGLVHDVGQLILASNFETEYQQLIQRAVEEDKALDVLEQEVFGLSHDYLAVKVCQVFRLPEEYREVMEGFHSALFVEEADSQDQWQWEYCVLALAHHLLRQNRLNGVNIHETLNVSAEFAQQVLGLDEQQVQDIVEKARSAIASTR